MLGETEDKWKYAVEKADRAGRRIRVTIYQMEVPFNTGIAKEAREHGGVSTVASWAQKRAWVDYAFKQFEAAGYVVSSGYTLVKPERHAGFVYRDSLWHGADLVGTGVASLRPLPGRPLPERRHLGAVHRQARRRRAADQPGACRSTEHQRLIREMILQLKTGKIDAGYFREKFGVEIAERVPRGLRLAGRRGLRRRSTATTSA